MSEEIRRIVREEIRAALKELDIAKKIHKCDFCFGEAYADEELVHGEEISMRSATGMGYKCRRSPTT